MELRRTSYRVHRRLILSIIGLIAAAAGGQLQARVGATDAETLKIATQALLDAVATGDRAVWKKHLDDSIVHVDENGVKRTKTELIAELSPLPPGLSGHLEVAHFEARITDDVAITYHEDQERLDYHGQLLHSRFRSVDTWRKTAEGWRLIATHIAAVQRDPPPTKITQHVLCEFNGVYQLTAAIVATVSCDEDVLRVERRGRPEANYLAETRDIFFEAGKPRVRRIFERDAQGRVTGFVDRREGEDIRWRRVEPTK